MVLLYYVVFWSQILPRIPICFQLWIHNGLSGLFSYAFLPFFAFQPRPTVILASLRALSTSSTTRAASPRTGGATRRLTARTSRTRPTAVSRDCVCTCTKNANRAFFIIEGTCEAFDFGCRCYLTLWMPTWRLMKGTAGWNQIHKPSNISSRILLLKPHPKIISNLLSSLSGRLSCPRRSPSP